MSTRLHERASDLFLEVCDLPAPQRDSRLDEACAGLPQLRAEVLSLLAHDREGSGLLEPERGLDRPQTGGLGSLARRAIASVPDRVGPYRVVRSLGEGGMATVYLAEPDGAPHQRVAVKMIKPGLNNAEITARFEAERQALTLLDHPAIAKVLDGGISEEGRPYFAMEYVPGIPITDYCDKHRLPIGERVALLAEVCGAVHYAHEHGLIHRDLKPSNVLVTLCEDAPRPKIIDFGVARAAKLGSGIDFFETQQGTLLGTPAYMSPEQAEMSALDIDPRADVYSLGVLLYELLTGRLPVDWRSLETHSLDGIREAIREADPVRPSRCFKLTDEETARHAKHRRSSARSLARELRGSLDAIVARAIDEDRTRRYATASEFGADIESYLRGESSPSRRTALSPRRLWFARGRRRSALAALILLAVAAAVTTWLASGRGVATLLDRSDAVAALEARERAGGRAEKIQFEIERTDPQLWVAAAADLSAARSAPPEASLVLVQATVRAGRRAGNDDLERSAISLLREPWSRLEDKNGSLAAGIMALLAEIRPELDIASVLPGSPPEIPEPVTADELYLRSFATLDEERALAYAQHAVELQPQNVLALRRLAHLAEVNGRFDRSISVARRLVAAGETERDWRLFEAAVLVEGGRYRDAATLIDAESRLPGRAAIAYEPLRAVCHLCLGEHDAAAAALSRAIDAAPTAKSGYLYYQRATPHWIAGRLEAAIADYEAFRALDGRPTFADVRLMIVRNDLARILDDRGDRDAANEIRALAADNFRKARANVQSGSWLARIFAGAAGELSPSQLVRAADPADAEQLCEAYYYAGEFSLSRGDIGSARDWFRKALETEVVFDPSSFPPTAMNEFHLARFRLTELTN